MTDYISPFRKLAKALAHLAGHTPLGDTPRAEVQEAVNAFHALGGDDEKAHAEFEEKRAAVFGAEDDGTDGEEIDPGASPVAVAADPEPAPQPDPAPPAAADPAPEAAPAQETDTSQGAATEETPPADQSGGEPIPTETDNTGGGPAGAAGDGSGTAGLDVTGAGDGSGAAPAAEAVEA